MHFLNGIRVCTRDFTRRAHVPNASSDAERKIEGRKRAVAGNVGPWDAGHHISVETGNNGATRGCAVIHRSLRAQLVEFSVAHHYSVHRSHSIGVMVTAEHH